MERARLFSANFYEVICDRTKQIVKLTVTENAILLFDIYDLYSPKSTFHYAFLRNIYYTNVRITLEVNLNKGNADNLTNITEKLTFICKSEILCKTIWEFVVAQYQLYLFQQVSQPSIDTAQLSDFSVQTNEYSIQNFFDNSCCNKSLKSGCDIDDLSKVEKVSNYFIDVRSFSCSTLSENIIGNFYTLKKSNSDLDYSSSINRSVSATKSASSFLPIKKSFKKQNLSIQNFNSCFCNSSESVQFIPFEEACDCSHSSVSSLFKATRQSSIFCTNKMPSAKIADGQLCKIVQDVNCEKNEEEKKRDLELFKKLDVRRQNLEDKLLEKLEELKAACVQEGELTGNLPMEIYKTLMPGEMEPKIKRRVGTTFKYSQQVLQHTTDDQTGQLEADVELHRKIVAAAERLAKDKNTNKSVRKKRRKDWQAASQKLKNLEKGLCKLRVSCSKPDVSVTFDSLLMSNFSNNGSGFSLNNLKGWPNFSHYSFRGSTKSCPTTPRGSVPDLSVIGGNHVKINNGRQLNMSMNSKKFVESQQQGNEFIKFPSSKSLLSTQYGEPKATAAESLPGAQLPPTIPHRRMLGPTLSVPSASSTAQQSSHEHFTESPLYANIGYTSSVSYKSAYRQSNFPTIQDSRQASSSNSCLNKSASTISTSTCFSVEKSSDENCIIEHPPNLNQMNNILRHGNESSTSIGSHDLPHIQRQLQQQRCSSSSQSSAGSISIGSIASTASSSGYHSSNLQVYPLVGSRGISALEGCFSDFKQPLSLGAGGYSTTSLDRRILRESSSSSSLLTNDDNTYLKSLYNNRLRLGPNAMITTFPVNDYCRPLKLSDLSKYRSNSAVRVVDPNWPSPSPSSTLKKSSVSASGLPLFSSATLSRFPNNYQYNFPTNPRMEALLASIHPRSSHVYNSNTHGSYKSITAEPSIENAVVVAPVNETNLSKNVTMV